MKHNTMCIVVLSLATLWASFACVSLSQKQKDKLADIIAAVPTPTAAPAPTATPTPIPPPTPVPDVSLNASMRGVDEFAQGENIPTMDTGGRGIFLDFRGRVDFAEKHALWCAEAKGAAMPAATDDEPRGIFWQCR